MSTHEYPWPIWNNLSESTARRFQDIEYFKIELQKLIERKRDQYPRGGALYILETGNVFHTPIEINERIQLGDSLKSSSFDDMGNMDWEFKKYDSQVVWWRLRLGMDVVCIPGYTEEKILDPFYYRIFTRSTYLEINNKNK